MVAFSDIKFYKPAPTLSPPGGGEAIRKTFSARAVKENRQSYFFIN